MKPAGRISLSAFPGRSAALLRCAAEPGPSRTPAFGTVPALRSGMKNAAARPGHETAGHGIVPRTQRSAISAFTRVFDALWLLRSGALQSRGRTKLSHGRA